MGNNWSKLILNMSTTKVNKNSGPPRNAKLLETHPSGKRHLPLPKGPHSVGFVDIMTEGDPSSGTFFRLYYPSNERCQEEHEKWPRWAFEDKYISGTLTFLKCMALLNMMNRNISNGL